MTIVFVFPLAFTSARPGVEQAWLYDVIVGEFEFHQRASRVDGMLVAPFSYSTT
jgi:hypothetical protein